MTYSSHFNDDIVGMLQLGFLDVVHGDFVGTSVVDSFHRDSRSLGFQRLRLAVQGDVKIVLVQRFVEDQGSS